MLTKKIIYAFTKTQQRLLLSGPQQREMGLSSQQTLETKQHEMDVNGFRLQLSNSRIVLFSEIPRVCLENAVILNQNLSCHRKKKVLKNVYANRSVLAIPRLQLWPHPASWRHGGFELGLPSDSAAPKFTDKLNGIDYQLPVKIITFSIKIEIGISQGEVGPSTIQSP